MTISKALKQKNKLVSELKQLKERIEGYTSVIKGNPRPYDIGQLQANVIGKIHELIALKTSIAQANSSVYAKIFELSELKGLVQFYKHLEIKEGVIAERYSSEPQSFESVLKADQRDALVAEFIERIEVLQDELDEFNALTQL